MKTKRILSIAMMLILTVSMAACNPHLIQPDVDPYPPDDEPPVVEPVNDPDSEPTETGKTFNNPEGPVVIFEDNFDDGIGPEWGTYANYGEFSMYGEDGMLVVDITRCGTLDYSCQVFRDGFSLYKGAVYEASFDIYSDYDARQLQWRFQVNGGDYHYYFQEDKVPIGTEKQTITKQFTMEEDTDPAPRFCFNLGFFEGMDKKQPHKVYIDNFKLTLIDASNVEEDMSSSFLSNDAPAIKVNQVGYKTNDVKKVVATSDTALTEFKVCKASDDSVVFTGNFADPVEGTSDDGTTYTGDFSSVKDAGTYYVSVEGLDNSYTFEIGDDIYKDVTKDVVRMLYMQRCGCELPESLAGDFAHPECHTAKAKIYGTNDYIDVSGGWHDAGDYGRYVVPGAKTVEDLFLTYEDCAGADGDDYDIPESGNGIPDILDEARYELDWMLKMQASDGGVYHKVTCAAFPGTVMPEEETDELIVCPISLTATGDFAAVMAKASVIYKDIDKDFASKCLEASKKAYAYMEKNAAADTTGYINPSEIATGEYPDAVNKDEFLFAAVELYLATGDDAYANKIKELMNDVPEGLGWIEMGTYAFYDYLKADKSLQKDDITKVLNEKLIQIGKSNLEMSKTDPYFSSMRTYPWGSNMSIANTGMLYMMIYNLTGDEEYLEYANHQLDYIFGMNPNGYSYVTCVGTRYPSHPHHRPSQAIGSPVPGMLVGGPNSDPADPYAMQVLAGKKDACCYVDNDGAYSINEVTIYWNSPLIYLIEACGK